jgi:CHASE3 domain sensor protein
MRRSKTFGWKLGLGLAVQAMTTLVLAVAAIYAMYTVTAAKDEVITKNARMLADAQKLENIALERPGNVRAYLLTGDSNLVTTIKDLGEQFFVQLASTRELASTPEEIEHLNKIGEDAKDQFAVGDKVVAMRQSQEDSLAVGKVFQDEVAPRFATLRTDVREFVALEERILETAKNAASDRAWTAIIVVFVFAVAGVLTAVVLAGLLTRMLSRQIGSAVQHIQSSSSELQAAANQQTTGAKEQAALMAEISTTIKQLMSTAKQIAESAQGVARIADGATAAAQAGDEAVSQSQDRIAAIRKQVDVVVEHMLDLGKRSQQIGNILEIINELAEQTNILAINATIEAAGAGEAGKRFSVVADEIRKLADRVGGSTKEIRALIDQIRTAVNAAVMATESGSKAVEAGARQFGEVTATFRRISDLLGNTTEAAKEIELSTKQQSTAVEQVNIAVANVAQAARESEASSSQVLQTVAELTDLSRGLGRLISADGQA